MNFTITSEFKGKLPGEFYLTTNEDIYSATGLVALDEHRNPIGAIWYGTFGSPEIAGVYVVPEHRRKGAGSALYQAAADRLGVPLTEVLPHPRSLSPEARALRVRLGMPLERRRVPLPPVLLLNTTIMTALPPEGDATIFYRVRRLNVETARAVVAGRETLSAIGHESTAAAMGELLGIPVAVNRIAAEQAPGQPAIALKLRGRLPEGQILDSAALNAIGYDLFLVEASR